MNIHNFFAAANTRQHNGVARCGQPQQQSQACQNGNSLDGYTNPMVQRMQAAQQSDMLTSVLSMLQMILGGQGNGANLQQMMQQQQNAAAFQQGYQQGAAYSQGYQAGLQAAHGQHHIEAGGPPARNIADSAAAWCDQKTAGSPAWNGHDVGGPPARLMSETGGLTAGNIG